VKAVSYAKRVALVGVSACVLVLRWLGWAARRLAGVPVRARCVALYYHGVPAGRRGEFAWQMDEVLRCATPLEAAATCAAESGGHFAMLTFDDGFRSFIEGALPELESRGIPAALFVPAGNLGRPPEWLAGTGHADAGETVLDAEEVRLLPPGLVTVGSHTLTHARLSELAEADVRRELVESRVRLERLLGRPVTLLSLPHGDFDARVLELAREAEYTRVFTVTPRLAVLGDGEFVTGRCPASPDDWRIEFRLKVRGAYSWLAAASAAKRKVIGLLRRRVW
jgi:peptidoglycan/xylan/chitin deacetylase (PgdA/CDA1 family)